MFASFRKLVPQSTKNYYHFGMAFIAALIFRFPARKLKIVGVTGTDGKTTTTNLIYHLLKASGEKVSMISTVKAVIGEQEYSTGLHVTTPSPFQMQKFLSQMVRAGTKVAVIEMTSHGLDQNRVAFIPVYTGIITNISHEHLDYHKTFAAYIEAKSKILKGTKYRVLNCDDGNFDKLRLVGSGLLLSFGTKATADFRAGEVSETINGISFKLTFKDKQKKAKSIKVLLPVLGRFNVYNALAALSAISSLGVDIEAATASLANFELPSGRMQLLNEGQDFSVIIDFAHTPAALGSALKALGQYQHERLIAVFGAASERDRAKRPMMGKIATELADLSIFTSEDPRNEDPAKIIEEIASGAEAAGGSINETYWKIPDRGQAIGLAVKNLAKRGDIVAIFGKGHEASMNIDGEELPWSDEEVARKAVRARLIK